MRSGWRYRPLDPASKPIRGPGSVARRSALPPPCKRSERIAMRTLSAPADAYHLRAMVERMVQEGRTEDEIVAAVSEAEHRPSPPAAPTARHWPTRLVRA